MLHHSHRRPLVEAVEELRGVVPWADTAVVLRHPPTPEERVTLYARGVVSIEVRPTAPVLRAMVWALARRWALVTRAPEGEGVGGG